mgnify:CR=1 FL=1
MKKVVLATVFSLLFPLSGFSTTFLFLGKGDKCEKARDSLRGIPNVEVISEEDITAILEETKIKLIKEGRFEKWLPSDFIVICDEIEEKISYRIVDLLKGEILKAETGVEAEGVRSGVEGIMKEVIVEEKKPVEKVFIDVEVIGEARGKLKRGTEKEVERVLLLRAKRDAVEKAYGMTVALQTKKDFERVISESRAFLSYRVLEKGVSGEEQYVKISAVVSVPKDVIDKYGLKKKEISGKGVEERFEEGIVNWGEGFIEAEGRVKRSGRSDELLRRAGFVSATGNILKILSKLNFDGEKTVEDVIKENPDMLYVIKGFVRDAEIVKEGVDGDCYFVRIRVPFSGVGGITSAFAQRINYSPPRWAEKGEEDVLIVVDASEVKEMKPAIFPQMKTDKGEKIYSAEFVSQESLKKDGAGKYLNSEKEVSGKKKITLKAIGVSGNGGCIVISEKDAEKVKKDGGGAVKAGRVVIIKGGRVGGTEG